MIRATVLAIVAASTLMLAACNTVSGAGRDLQSASDAVKDATR